MADVVELYDFEKGKPGEREVIPVVTAVAPHALDGFLGTRNEAERIRHLRRLRDEGVLIHSKKRLTQRVRGHDLQRAYVFRGYAHQVTRAARVRL